jgi:hypothetical protein
LRVLHESLDDVPALFFAVEVKHSIAPSRLRKPPEIFCLTFIMRPSRSGLIVGEGHLRIGEEA